MSYLNDAYVYGCKLAQEDFEKQAFWSKLAPATQGLVKRVGAGAATGGIIGGLTGGDKNTPWSWGGAALGAGIGGTGAGLAGAGLNKLQRNLLMREQGNYAGNVALRGGAAKPAGEAYGQYVNEMMDKAKSRLIPSFNAEDLSNLSKNLENATGQGISFL